MELKKSMIKKKQLYFGILILIILIQVLSQTIISQESNETKRYIFENRKPDPNSEDLTWYNITIRANEKTYYTLYLPLVLYKENISEIMKDLKVISGNVTFSTIKTEKGYALKVIGNGNAHLYAGKKTVKGGFLYQNLSIQESTEPIPYNESVVGGVYEEKVKWWVYGKTENNESLNFRIEMRVRSDPIFLIQVYSLWTDYKYNRENDTNQINNNNWTLFTGYYSQKDFTEDNGDENNIIPSFEATFLITIIALLTIVKKKKLFQKLRSFKITSLT